MLRVKSSRRPSGLKPNDYDHEIALVDHDAAATPTGSVTPEPNAMRRYSTTSRLLDLDEEEEGEDQDQNRNDQSRDQQDRSNKQPDTTQPNGHDDSHTEGESETRSSSNRVENGRELPSQTRPSIEVQGQ